jgi:undecaprenyl-diphosphatase
MPTFKSSSKNILFLLVFILSGATLAVIIDGLSTGTELTPFNTFIESVILMVRHPALTSIMINVTNIGSPLTLLCVSVILATILIFRGETYDTLLFMVSMLISMIAFIALKDTFQLARPDAALIGISGWSFPSGHATVSTAFFFTTAYSFFDWPKKPLAKTFLVGGCILGTALVCFSRIYLGAHWTLDILAGIALGLLTVSFVALIFNIFLEEKNAFGKIRRRKPL